MNITLIASYLKRYFETLGSITAHEAATDPHTGYQKESEKGSVNGYASLDGSGLVPDAQIPTGIARDSEVSTAISNHEAAADPHTGYQRESEKNAASGYAGLDASTNINTDQVATGSIENDAVTYAKIQNVTDARVLGRAAGSSGDVQELTAGAGISIASGAIASTITQYTDELAQDSIGNNLLDTATIDLVYDDATPTFSANVINDSISNAKLANVSTSTFKGRTTAGSGDPEDLTTIQATALLDIFTSSLKGLVPSSGGGTTNFLRADVSWAAPTATADPVTPYAMGSKTIPTANFVNMARRLILTGSQKVTIQGTGALRIN